jgi:uncharacterized MAPEG superfamily protein
MPLPIVAHVWRGKDTLNFELWSLVAATVLGIVHLAAAAFAYKAQVGNAYSVGPRDDDIRPEKLAGRLSRAQRNYLETFPFYATLILLVHISEGTGDLSFWGACLYLGGRVFYLPLYAMGVPWLRTFSWNIATLGIVVVGAQLFF